MAYPGSDIRERIHRLTEHLAADRRSVQVMEICGTHTMAIARAGLRSLLPEALRLVSGPGCPVCVTDSSYLDQAVALASGACGAKPIVATYGDMVRVPGREGSLAEARARGAEVEVVYSAEQAVELAAARPDRQVVFLAVGFETTAPGTALAIQRAQREGVRNFSVLAAHKRVLPAMRALLSAGDVRIDGFLCPGHVSVILGFAAYEPIVREFARPCVVAGFEAGQVLAGLAAILEQLAQNRPAAASVYPPVSADGNATARRLMEEVFTVTDARWRALGVIPDSGLELREALVEFDAAKRFDLPQVASYELPGCRCGDVLRGSLEPADCPLFAGRCTPRDPVGPCMVSSEGACAASYKYERQAVRGGRRVER
ncbi:MAG: hydrogenase formation protein HypD [Phycisphaerae bacterium]|nr:hydrogenase formation protein HypD [Phycisphaerae bacterium]